MNFVNRAKQVDFARADFGALEARPQFLTLPENAAVVHSEQRTFGNLLDKKRLCFSLVIFSQDPHQVFVGAAARRQVMEIFFERAEYVSRENVLVQKIFEDLAIDQLPLLPMR